MVGVIRSCMGWGEGLELDGWWGDDGDRTLLVSGGGDRDGTVMRMRRFLISDRAEQISREGAR